MLQNILKDERSSRKSVEVKHRRAQSTTTRMNRYLDSILQVNQELVATIPGNSKHLPPPTRLIKPSVKRSSTPRGPEREEVNEHRSSALRLRTTVLDEVDVGAAVVDAILVGRAGGDPIPSLTALYERLGFCAIQGEDEHNLVPSLPTSPSRAAVAGTFPKANSFEDDDEETFRRRPEGPETPRGFLSRGGDEVLAASRQCATGRNFDKDRARLGDDGERDGIKGYSFAHSPIARATSVAERSPKVLRRLEALESQLERERAAMEQLYKKMVHRVGTASCFTCCPRGWCWYSPPSLTSSPAFAISCEYYQDGVS